MLGNLTLPYLAVRSGNGRVSGRFYGGDDGVRKLKLNLNVVRSTSWLAVAAITHLTLPCLTLLHLTSPYLTSP